MKKFKLVLTVSVSIFLGVSFIAYARAITHDDSPATPAVDAKALFDSKCAKCHGKDGRAKSAHARHEHARDLTTAEWQNDVTDERIYNSISNGKKKMPAFKGKLTDEQIEALVSYVRRFRG